MTNGYVSSLTSRVTTFPFVAWRQGFYNWCSVRRHGATSPGYVRQRNGALCALSCSVFPSVIGWSSWHARGSRVMLIGWLVGSVAVLFIGLGECDIRVLGLAYMALSAYVCIDVLCHEVVCLRVLLLMSTHSLRLYIPLLSATQSKPLTP